MEEDKVLTPDEAASATDGPAAQEPVGTPPAAGNRNGGPDGSAPATETAGLETLQKELDETKAKAAEYLDGLQRERAAFANYKRRVEREQAEMYQNATGRVIARYLDILDDFDRALKDQPAEGEAAYAKWAEGISLIYRKFLNLLEAEGVTRLEADGQEFNPNLHEAVVHEDSDAHPSGHVTEVLRHGYKLGDRVIRPALVKVAK